MQEFRVGDYSYRTRHKLNARQQFHIARRVAPVISVSAAVLPMLQATLSQPNQETGDPEADARSMVQRIIELESLGRPIAEALAHLSDQDCDYVLDLCLSVVQRLQGANGSGVWADIWNLRANRILFEDIELPEMMQITMEVLKENVMGFFSVRQPMPTATMAAAQNTPASIG